MLETVYGPRGDFIWFIYVKFTFILTYAMSCIDHKETITTKRGFTCYLCQYSKSSDVSTVEDLVSSGS